MADLLLGLSAAVVKIACKVWLKDHEFAADAAAEVVDVIKDKVAGDLDQRQARRLFEDLEVPVAEKLSSLRPHEFSGIPDNEWEAAVLGVGDTLRSSKFTEADVFAGDLDPLYLRRLISAASPMATRDLSEAGTAVYDRLLTECCAYVVELTSTLPRFNAGGFAEVLHRQSLILQRVNEVLNRMPSPDELREGVAREEADFAAAYRRQVVSQLDRLELFGVSVSESIRGYPLSTAYISLTVVSEGLKAGHSEGVGDSGKFPVSEIGELRIDDALAATSRLFLRGEAGSGKTTMLQWLAVRSARRDFPGRLYAWNDTIPFMIRLRHYIGKPLPAPEGFLGQLGQHIADEMPKGWVHELLRTGKALILVDGVDELPEAERGPAREWLGRLVEIYPRARYVVTSRSAAAADRWLVQEGFDAAEVQPMSWPDVQEFVRHWHAAFRDSAVDEAQRNHLTFCEETLQESLYGRRDLRLLATSPLLSALICALHLERRMHLPRDRMELYAVALDMLLERRDAERRISDGEPVLSKTDKALILEDLAFWLIRNGWSDAEKSRVIERFEHRLFTMPQIHADADNVLDQLLQRSGLIREPVAGRIDFIHRTFEEYLAANAAVNDDQIGELVRNAHDDQWREVVVLAAGHAQPRQRDELLVNLLARARVDQGNQQTLQILAVACLETSPQLDYRLHSEIQKVAAELLPPSSIRQAETLARVGEPLLDLLASRPVRRVDQAAATIRAASIVGGHAALRLIKSAALFKGNSVRNEVMRAWPFFDARDYAVKVVSGSPYAKSLLITDPALASTLKCIPELTSLTLDFVDGSGDLSVIEDLPQLKYLSIPRDAKLKNLSPLRTHPGLESVLLYDSSEIDLRPLATVPHLYRLRFRADTSAHADSIRDCLVLRHLELVNVPALISLGDYLPGCALTSLQLEGNAMEDLSDFVGVRQLSQLEILSLSFCERLASLKGIEGVSATLRSLALGGNGSHIDMSSLASLRKLRRLELDWSPRPNLTVIRDLPELQDLYLADNQPVDLTPLRGIALLTIHVGKGQKVRGAELLGNGSRVVDELSNVLQCREIPHEQPGRLEG